MKNQTDMSVRRHEQPKSIVYKEKQGESTMKNSSNSKRQPCNYLQLQKHGKLAVYSTLKVHSVAIDHTHVDIGRECCDSSKE